jgi:transcriptional regulator with XRE-family HTH domain
MNIGSEIRAKREAKGYSRPALVLALRDELLIVHRNTIANWEGGVTQPKYRDLIVLQKVLGISLKEDDNAIARNEDAPHE